MSGEERERLRQLNIQTQNRPEVKEKQIKSALNRLWIQVMQRNIILVNVN